MQDYFEKHLVNMSKSCVVQPHGLVMAPRYPTYHSQHLSYPCKESDIWVATFAKCGTTWTQELVWCLIKGMDDPNGKKPLMERFPFFEWVLFFGGIGTQCIHIFLNSADFCEFKLSHTVVHWIFMKCILSKMLSERVHVNLSLEDISSIATKKLTILIFKKKRLFF